MNHKRMPVNQWAELWARDVECKEQSARDVLGIGVINGKMYPEQDALPYSVQMAIKRNESATY